MMPETGELQLDERRISYTVARSKRRRRSIGFVMESPSALKVVAPIRASLSSIHAVIQKQTPWILRRLRQLQNAQTERKQCDGLTVMYLGHACAIGVTHDENAPQGVRLRPHKLIVNLPVHEPSFVVKRGIVPLPLAARLRQGYAGFSTVSCEAAEQRSGRGVRGGLSQQIPCVGAIGTSPPLIPPASGGEILAATSEHHETIRLEILLWIKKRAKAKFRKRMEFWARLLGVTYRELKIANAGQRWGSCNAQNVIRLNWRLIMAPLAILDYIVVHELCHIRHKNHGVQFWAQVASVLPDHKARRKRLRQIGETLLLP